MVVEVAVVVVVVKEGNQEPVEAAAVPGVVAVVVAAVVPGVVAVVVASVVAAVAAVTAAVVAALVLVLVLVLDVVVDMEEVQVVPLPQATPHPSEHRAPSQFPTLGRPALPNTLRQWAQELPPPCWMPRGLLPWSLALQRML